MKRLAAITLVFLLSYYVVSAQSADEKAVATAVETLRKAMIDADKTTLETLVAEQLSYGHSSGTMEDKATFVDVIVSGKNNYNSIELSGQTIKLADNTAIVRHKFIAEIAGNGTINTITVGVLQVWQKQKGKWKLIARQAFKL